MCIHDFPATPFPKGVKCQQQKGIQISIIEPSMNEGLCEVCCEAVSTVIFDIGYYHHHLCKECFETMMRKFAEKSNSVLLKNVESTRMVSGHFEFK